MQLLVKIGFLEMGWIDILDILLVSILLYELYRLVKGSVALRIVLGGVAVVFIWWLVRALDMELLSTILGQFIGVGVLGALILFQQEIRRFLLVIGKANYLSNNRLWRVFSGNPLPKTNIELDIFVEVAQEMASSLTGALIVFAKSSELKFYTESGDKLDALASKRLILSIFNKYSPLHDGAMIVGKDGRILAVRCILPVSENHDLPASLGLRHRSAIGLTEVTDSIVLVVSEETGQISLVKSGHILRDLTAKQLKSKLLYYLTHEDEEEEVDNLELKSLSEKSEINLDG
jgi:diadenylate cyclase